MKKIGRRLFLKSLLIAAISMLQPQRQKPRPASAPAPPEKKFKPTDFYRPHPWAG